MLQLMKKIAAGKGTRTDVEKIKEIGNAMCKASLCGLGQTAPNPVLSTMKFFKNEYDALLTDEPVRQNDTASPDNSQTQGE